MSSAERNPTPVVVGKAYELLPKAEKSPRSFRFSPGDRAVSAGLELFQPLAESPYSTEKAELNCAAEDLVVESGTLWLITSRR